MARCIWIGHELPPIRRGDTAYFLLSVDGELFLVEDRCPHRGGRLRFGRLNEREELVCPMHGNAFSIDVLLRRSSTLRLAALPGSNPDDASG